jgi:16S rRNA G1207 methylase RsmC
MNFNYKESKFDINRYPATDNKSLKPWNAGEELALNYFLEKDVEDVKIAICNDKFGFMSVVLNKYNPVTIIDYNSQEKAVKENFSRNNVKVVKANFISPLDNLESEVDFGFIKIPKSTDLFRLYLNQIHQSLNDGGEVICYFMTKNFNKTILKIAEEFFENVEQSLAWKKSRLLTLRGKKEVKEQKLVNTLVYSDDKTFKQYLGVFSAKNIDYASQYFINYISVLTSDKKVLDLASGNGVLAHVVTEKCKGCEVHLMDDSVLAIESSKLNVDADNLHFHCDDTLDEFEKNSFDLVVSNPPFHFEYENNIEVSLSLFRGVHEILKSGGRFQLVANIHLNYKIHLDKIFSTVEVLGENGKFIVYECVK